MRRMERARDGRLDAAVDFFLRFGGESPDADYLRDLLVTIARLQRDGTPRADLKVLASALKELRYAFKVFRPFAGIRKVTVFGSARLSERDPAAKMARRFAETVAREGFMVITGAGDGIMGAAQRGAGRERSFGINIRLPFEQVPNEEIRADRKLVTFKYFFSRKLVFVKEADAIVLFPGGFGTLDEGFEVLTLLQTGKTDPKPLVLLAPKGSGYWAAWERYVRTHLLRPGLISPEDLALYRTTWDVEEAVREIVGFYRVYHSSRYVNGDLVLRLTAPLPEGAIARLQADFADILEGPLRPSAALPEEADAPEIAHLPRLVVPFGRRNFGRLRLFLDAVNACGIEGCADASRRRPEGAPEDRSAKSPLAK